MTHSILQSDVDFARRLLDVSRPDEEIVAALSKRGLDVSRASQLVRDLRCGVPVKAESVKVPKARETVGSRQAFQPAQSKRPFTAKEVAAMFLALGLFVCVLVYVFSYLTPILGEPKRERSPQFVESWGCADLTDTG